jgi:hypothetical protein
MMVARKIEVLSLNKSTVLGLHLKMSTLRNLLAEIYTRKINYGLKQNNVIYYFI